MSLSVALTPSGLDPGSLDGRAVVVIDVLRASTSIATALANGARAVIPVADKGEAGRLAATLDRDTSVLAGERDGVMLPGFTLGNSPREMTAEAVGGKTVVLTTTNGTYAIVAAKKADRLAVGTFVNAAATAAFLSDALADGLEATIVCAGWRGEVGLEDVLCAGLLADRVGGAGGDGALIALGLYRGAAANLGRAVASSEHARRLASLGAADDVTACVRVDALDVLPVYRDNQLVAG
ncbi:2-phosphosulfolactate phosphatase [Rubrivirga sp. IMCC43871]|uniref:2-phosphosulfolactate phosphatase n=1 Tax=Rubrivirga sp. IMCC43871 TaxID=3391575 RepID=UPI00398FE8C3